MLFGKTEFYMHVFKTNVTKWTIFQMDKSEMQQNRQTNRTSKGEPHNFVSI